MKAKFYAIFWVCIGLEGGWHFLGVGFSRGANTSWLLFFQFQIELLEYCSRCVLTGFGGVARLGTASLLKPRKSDVEACCADGRSWGVFLPGSADNSQKQCKSEDGRISTEKLVFLSCPSLPITCFLWGAMEKVRMQVPCSRVTKDLPQFWRDISVHIAVKCSFFFWPLQCHGGKWGGGAAAGKDSFVRASPKRKDSKGVPFLWKIFFKKPCRWIKRADSEGTKVNFLSCAPYCIFQSVASPAKGLSRSR